MPFIHDLNQERAIALLASVPTWFKWGVRKGASIDQVAFRAAFPDGVRRCPWCTTPVANKRRVWCTEEHRNLAYQLFFWPELSWVCWHRDGYRCVRCAREVGPVTTRWNREAQAYDVTGLGYETDHILPVRNGGTDDPANLRTLCHDCHVAVGYEQRAAEKPQMALGLSEKPLALSDGKVAEVIARP